MNTAYNYNEREAGTSIYSTHCPSLCNGIYFDTLRIIWALKGSLIAHSFFSDYHLNENDIYIANITYPCVSFIPNPDNDIVLLVMEIDLEYYKRFFNKISDAFYFTCNIPHDVSKGAYDEKLDHIRYLMAKAFSSLYNSSNPKIIIENTSRELVGFLLDNFSNYKFTKDKDDVFRVVLDIESEKRHDNKLIYRIIDYIYDNYNGDISLEDIAEKEYLSVGYISKYIKEISGISYSEHLSMARCEKAAELLITTKKNIDTIAEEVGYSNRQHLNLNFKRWFNLTPSKYRNASILFRKEALHHVRNNNIDIEKTLNFLHPYLSTR